MAGRQNKRKPAASIGKAGGFSGTVGLQTQRRVSLGMMFEEGTLFSEFPPEDPLMQLFPLENVTEGNCYRTEFSFSGKPVSQRGQFSQFLKGEQRLPQRAERADTLPRLFLLRWFLQHRFSEIRFSVFLHLPPAICFIGLH